jgi:hypothetical protein
MYDITTKIKIIILVFCITSLCFYNGSDWNQNSRWNVIFSFVEKGPNQYSFKINQYIQSETENINTGDWSKYNGNYFSNKAPGTALLGIPLYFIIYNIEKLFNIESILLFHFNCYLLNFFLSILPISIGLYYFAVFLKSLNVEGYKIINILLALCFASLFLPYSTQLWGHITAASFVMMALSLTTANNRNHNFIFGILLSFALITDYLAIIVCAGLFLHKYLVSKLNLYAFLGMIPPLLLHLIYNKMCFDNLFAVPTDFMNPAFINKSSAIGVFNFININALYELTFGLYRGLFLQMPILLMALYSFYKWYRRDKYDKWLLISFTIVLLQLILNSSFNGWHSGAGFAARYQITALPFWFLALKEFCFKGTEFRVYRTLLFISILNMLVCTSVGVLTPMNEKNPLYLWSYGLFFSFIPNLLGLSGITRWYGNLTPIPLPIRLEVLDSNFSLYAKYTAWNFFELFGINEIITPLVITIILTYTSLKYLKKNA